MPAFKQDQLLVFDIQRFAIHDGSGLRSTIFLKGCPLHCAWCQNPEGMDPVRRPVWLKKECIHCRSCQHADPALVRYDENQDRPVFANRDLPCDHVLEACPAAAIRFDSTWWNLEDLLEEVKKDEVFFARNGGITVSGGEPFMQPEALRAFLQKAKKAGLHTAVETSLMADWKTIEPALEFLDEIYCDCKIFDDDQHKKWTRSGNTVILENLNHLLSGPHAAKVTVRTPLIPGATDSAENIRQIAAYISDLYPEVRYELLNYNPLAPAKYPMAEKDWPLGQHLQPLNQNQLKKLEEAARKGGIQNLMMPE